MTTNHEEEMIDMQEVATTAGVTLDQINRTIAKIEAGLKEWEEGRMTSPDDRDHVIEACEVLGVDWHQIDRDTDNDIVGKIANEIYEDSGETITDIPDLATYILTRLFQEGLRPVEGETLQDEVEETLKREFLIHINVQIECEKADIDVETVQREIAGALEVGLGDMSHTPHLQGAEVEISLAEEI